jgi:hypothetical protein
MIDWMIDSSISLNLKFGDGCGYLNFMICRAVAVAVLPWHVFNCLSVIFNDDNMLSKISAISSSSSLFLLVNTLVISMKYWITLGSRGLARLKKRKK